MEAEVLAVRAGQAYIRSTGAVLTRRSHSSPLQERRVGICVEIPFSARYPVSTELTWHACSVEPSRVSTPPPVHFAYLPLCEVDQANICLSWWSPRTPFPDS